MATNDNGPPFPPGSLLRAVWLDEILDSAVAYDAQANDGWVSSGIIALKSEEYIAPYSFAQDVPGGWVEDIPHGQKGLLFIKWVEYQEQMWYCVLHGEKLLWCRSKELVLEKRGDAE